MIFGGCATNKDVIRTDTKVTAKGTPEGIQLDFINIPNDTSHLFIGIWESTKNNDLQTNVSFFNDSLGYSGNVLSDLNKSGSLICPFLKEGQEYTIYVSFNDIDLKPINMFTLNAVAGGGIYLTNKPILEFTDENTTVTLSEMPEFSEEVKFPSQGKLEFTNFVIMEDGSTYGGGWSHWNELSYPAREVLSGTQEHFGFTGYFPVTAFVHCWLIDGNTEWSVAVAKTDENAIMSF
jgi:hypothetical protein